MGIVFVVVVATALLGSGLSVALRRRRDRGRGGRGAPAGSGAQGTGRIVVGVSGSLGSLAALRHACRLARRDRKPVLAVLAYTPPGGELAYRQAPCPPLSVEWERQAMLRLMDAFDAALGGFPRDVTVKPLVLRAPAARALTSTADRAEDMLVVGAGPGHLPGRMFHGFVRRRVLAHAACPVLAVPAPALPRRATRALRHADPTDFRL
jgi:nucleotide-binding universal stress UspA family protein